MLIAYFVPFFVQAFLVNLGVCGFFFLIPRCVPGLRTRFVDGGEVSRRQLARELFRSFIGLLVSCVLMLTVFFIYLPVEWSKSWTLNITYFVLMLTFFELWFYFIHRALHSPKLFRFHRIHHLSVPPTPFSSTSFSIVELMALESGKYVFSFAFALFAPIPLAGYFAHAWFLFLVNVIGHSHVELFSQSALRKSRLFNYIASATYHSAHHSDPRSRYALLFIFLDRWFGTGLPPYREAKTSPAKYF